MSVNRDVEVCERKNWLETSYVPWVNHYCGQEKETVQEAFRVKEKARRENRPPCLIVVVEDPSEKEIVTGFVSPPELAFGLTTSFLKGAAKGGPVS
jgi:hypothetical protein